MNKQHYNKISNLKPGSLYKFKYSVFLISSFEKRNKEYIGVYIENKISNSIGDRKFYFLMNKKIEHFHAYEITDIEELV